MLDLLSSFGISDCFASIMSNALFTSINYFLRDCVTSTFLFLYL
jgi:hypothetical protein